MAALHFMQLQAALQGVEQFDGKEPPLRTFLYDVEQGLSMIPDSLKQNYTMGILRKLRGNAREAVEGRTFRKTEDLIKFLRDTFSPAGLTLSQCQTQLAQLRMGANESASDYAFRTQRLVGKAKSALLSQNFPEEQIPTLMGLIKATALEGFRRGLRPDIELRVFIKKPETLEDALEFARQEELFFSEQPHNRENATYTPRLFQNYSQQRYQPPQTRNFGPSQGMRNGENKQHLSTPRVYGSPRPPVHHGYRPPQPGYGDIGKTVHYAREIYEQPSYDCSGYYGSQEGGLDPPDYHSGRSKPYEVAEVTSVMPTLCARCCSELDNLQLAADSTKVLCPLQRIRI